MTSQEHVIHFTLLILVNSQYSLSFITNCSLVIGVVYPESGGSMFVRIGGTYLPDLTDYHYRSQHLSPPQEPQIAKSHKFNWTALFSSNILGYYLRRVSFTFRLNCFRSNQVTLEQKHEIYTSESFHIFSWQFVFIFPSHFSLSSTTTAAGIISFNNFRMNGLICRSIYV
jgi:hypothetical protein